MKIVSWNCQGAYHKKIDKILELNPDIVVIQESENLEALRTSCRDKIPLKSFWFGGFYELKGVGVFFYDDFDILSMEYDTSVEFIIPMKVRGEFEFYLFAVWAMAPKEEGKSYTLQVERAIRRYEDILKNNDTILIGDYNTFRIHYPIDKAEIEYSLVDSFRDLGFYSAYHKYFKKDYGEHSHYTFYQYRKADSKHMLDYCFASESLINKISKVSIGKYEDWKEFSDHCPLIIDFEEPSESQ